MGIGENIDENWENTAHILDWEWLWYSLVKMVKYKHWALSISMDLKDNVIEGLNCTYMMASRDTKLLIFLFQNLWWNQAKTRYVYFWY